MKNYVRKQLLPGINDHEVFKIVIQKEHTSIYGQNNLLNITFHALTGIFQLELFIFIIYFSTVDPLTIFVSSHFTYPAHQQRHYPDPNKFKIIAHSNINLQWTSCN